MSGGYKKNMGRMCEKALTKLRMKASSVEVSERVQIPQEV